MGCPCTRACIDPLLHAPRSGMMIMPIMAGKAPSTRQQRRLTKALRVIHIGQHADYADESTHSA